MGCVGEGAGEKMSFSFERGRFHAIPPVGGCDHFTKREKGHRWDSNNRRKGE